MGTTQVVWPLGVVFIWQDAYQRPDHHGRHRAGWRGLTMNPDNRPLILTIRGPYFCRQIF
jgi:hypothetical protein